QDVSWGGWTALARPPVMLVPAGTSFQPLDVTEVAERLAGLAVVPAAGRVPDLAGPQVRPATDLAHSFLRASGRRRPVVPAWLPGAAAAGFRCGGHCAPDSATATVTFGDFLAPPVSMPGTAWHAPRPAAPGRRRPLLPPRPPRR